MSRAFGKAALFPSAASSAMIDPLIEQTLTVPQRRQFWGDAPTAEHEVWTVFAKYIEGAVPWLPWCEGLMAETGTIDRDLVCLNEAGILTINSQPRVLAAPSDDPCFGWGGAGGLVYQKACVGSVRRAATARRAPRAARRSAAAATATATAIAVAIATPTRARAF
jgi:methylenetetrahydrofolate reductase (NADPH)